MDDLKNAYRDTQVACARALGILMGMRQLGYVPTSFVTLVDGVLAEYEAASTRCNASAAEYEAKKAIEAAQAEVRG